MSSASKSLEIKFNAKTGTYTAIIQSPNGDIYQEYQKAGETVSCIRTSKSRSQNSILSVPLREWLTDSPHRYQ